VPSTACRRVAAGAAVACLTLLCAALPGLGNQADPLLREAHLAWDRGDYPAALRGYMALLDTGDAERLLPPIALQTGELFHTIELTDDGGAPQFSPDGRYVAYEAGRGPTRRTRIAPTETPAAATTELPGYGASFSPDGSQVAYLRPLSSTADGRREPHAEVAVRRLGDGAERRVNTGGRNVTAVLAAANGLVLVTSPDADGIDQLSVVGVGRAPVTLTSGLPARVLRAMDATGTQALVTHRLQRPGEPVSFGLVSLSEPAITLVEGSSPAFSADGRSIVWVRQADGSTQLLAAASSAPRDATVVRAGAEPVDFPALSPDGGRVAFQMMPEHDWEIHVVNRDGSGERRVTQEVQHDVAPRFLTSHQLIGLMGEPRHRRSFLYDLDAGTRTRLFHNNTVRTIAPEYQWSASPDGVKLLVVADRDGDTVSPKRGVYLMDLRRAVTNDALRARLIAGLTAEEELRSRGRRLFDPLADQVRRAVGEASVQRILEYQQALFTFGSKHISQPGNRAAAEYLFATYRSFGYEPEYEWFEPPGALDGRTANVLATLRGTLHPEIVYIVSSHYDSVGQSAGADDNSSGTAALLETARIMAARPQPATIMFVSFTGEESGLLGSREFVRRALAAGTRIAGVLNNDMIGWANDHRLDNTIRYGSRGIRDIQHAAAIHFTGLVTYDARYFRGTDAHAFYDGYGEIFGGIGSYPVLGNPHYHRPGDILETINHQLVTEVAKTTAASVMLLASSPAPVSDLRLLEFRSGEARLAWAPSHERDVTGYVLQWEGPAGQPMRRTHVSGTSAVLQAAAGSSVSVRAVNATGLESWDETRIVID
jgi:Tol biopolymer transport system component